MVDENNIQRLEAELRRLETQLETPIVPGDLVEWLQAVGQAHSMLLPALRGHVQQRHRESIEAIAEQDPGLLTRVERLKDEDRAILLEAERQFKIVSPIAKHSENLEPDEGHAARAVEKIVDEGLALVIRIRKQEAAIRTWFAEAFHRDRGVAD